jgi:hypothetical protein
MRTQSVHSTALALELWGALADTHSMTPNVRLMSSAIGYARVSTFKQANRGVSLEAQADAIRSECERRGWTLADLCVDAAKSGKSLDKRDRSSVRWSCSTRARLTCLSQPSSTDSVAASWTWPT